jgi:hypothetical protein
MSKRKAGHLAMTGLEGTSLGRLDQRETNPGEPMYPIPVE